MQQSRRVRSHPTRQRRQESQKLPNTIGDDVYTECAVSTEGEVDRVDVYANGRPTPYFSLALATAQGDAPCENDAPTKDGSIPRPGNCPHTARAGRSLLFNAERYYEENVVESE